MSAPLPAIFLPGDASITARVVTTQFAILRVLSRIGYAKIGTAIVKTIAIDVINALHAKDEVVKPLSSVLAISREDMTSDINAI